MDLQTPSVSGYSIIERIGAGSYATVYKAWQNTTLDTPRDIVAIKCIDRQKLKSKVAGDNLVQEIQLLKSLRHRFIVEMRDFTWDARRICLILEYCAGGDLRQFIEMHRCLPEGVVRKFLQQLASALFYLRKANVAHMDLKPQNILLTSKRPPVFLKLADFGFARVLSDEYKSADKSLRGSPLYMAPEQFTGRGYDARVDLWSVGVILYECLFGRAPFSCDSMEELMVQISSLLPVTIPHSVPAPVPPAALAAAASKRPLSAPVSGSRPSFQISSLATPLSPACMSLLRGLLQRDPDVRLSFDEFFAHRFVDLDHAPSEEALLKAEKFAKQAERSASTGHAKLAIHQFCRAVEYFLPAIQWVATETERSQLQAKVRHYLARAEALKLDAQSASGAASGNDIEPTVTPRMIGANYASSSSSLTNNNSSRACKQTSGSGSVLIWADIPQVQAAYTIVAAAKELEMQGRFADAYAKYQLAIEPMLKVLNQEPKSSSRRSVLFHDVDAWITIAEQLKLFCDADEQKSRASSSETETAAGDHAETSERGKQPDRSNVSTKNDKTSSESKSLSAAQENQKNVFLVEQTTDSLVQEYSCLIQ